MTAFQFSNPPEHLLLGAYTVPPAGSPTALSVPEHDARARAMAAFLFAYCKKGTIAAASRFAGVSRATVTFWQNNYPEFVTRMSYAREDYLDSIRDEADRRGREGVLKEHRHYAPDGSLVDVWYERVYSDLLLMFHAKSLMPEYRDKIPLTDPEAEGKIPLAAVRDILKAARDATPAPVPAPSTPPANQVFEPDYVVRERDTSSRG